MMREALVNLLNKEPCPSIYTCSNACKYAESPHCLEERYADYLIANNVIILPCRKGDPIYQIKKFCDVNVGNYEFYRPTKEFDKPCQYFEDTYDGSNCRYPNLNIDDSWYNSEEDLKQIKDIKITGKHLTPFIEKRSVNRTLDLSENENKSLHFFGK